MTLDIYEDAGTAGILDIRKAKLELAASSSINIEGVRKAIVAEITAAALLDIAYSLRPIGAEAADALNDRAFGGREMGDGDETDDATQGREIVIGSLVVARGGDQPGEVLAMGYDQDSKYALVKWAESGDEIRVWIEELELLEPADEDELASDDEPPARETMRPEDGLGLVGTIGHEDALRALNAEADGEPDFDEDDLDRDFDTDTGGLAAIVEPPAPAVSTIAALAEKAPAKKKGSKK